MNINIFLLLLILLTGDSMFALYVIAPEKEAREKRAVIVKGTRELIEAKKSTDDSRLKTCFYLIACSKECPDLLEDLLQYGMNPNLCGPHGSVLCVAIIEKCLENIPLLVKYEADVNLRSSDGFFKRTPLEAAINYYTEINQITIGIVEFLLWCKADPNIQDEFGNTVLMTCIKKGGKFTLKLVGLLICYNADPTIKNNENIDAFNLACEYDEKFSNSHKRSLYRLIRDLAKVQGMIE